MVLKGSIKVLEEAGLLLQLVRTFNKLPCCNINSKNCLEKLAILEEFNFSINAWYAEVIE